MNLMNKVLSAAAIVVGLAAAAQPASAAYEHTFFPLAVGNDCVYSHTGGAGGVSRSEQVTGPAGTFAAIHIQFTTQCGDAGITDEWFVKGIGLVKRVEDSIAGPRTTQLERATISGKHYGTPAPAPAGLVRATV